MGWGGRGGEDPPTPVVKGVARDYMRMHQLLLSLALHCAGVSVVARPLCTIAQGFAQPIMPPAIRSCARPAREG